MKNLGKANKREDRENKKSRIALYVFFDRDGIVEDYVVYQLEQLQTVADKIVTICQGYIREDNKERLESVSDQVIYRDNTGYDAGAWKDAILNHVGLDEISKYDDLLLMNDSCFGPIYPFSEMFDEMESRNLDFWGVTEHGNIKDVYGLTKDGVFHPHIQSYFICFSENVHNSANFRKFWNELKETKNFEEAVSYFETELTQYFAKEGFKWGVYIDSSKYKGDNFDNYNPNIYGFDEFLIEQRNPLVKKKSFISQLALILKRSDGNLARKSIEYIEKNTGYDTNMIYDVIIRTGQTRTLYQLFHWDYILPENCSIETGVPNKKIAVVMHLFYEELFSYCHEYLKNIPEYFDIYITVADKAKKDTIEKMFSDIVCNKLEVRLVDNKGMDISALLIGARDIFVNDYDYVCFIHDKMSDRLTNPRAGEGFRDTLFNCTLKSKNYIENVIHTFDNNKRLGLLVPPYPFSGVYIQTWGMTWKPNYEGVKKIAEKIDLNCNIEEKKDPIAVGTVFWCRPAALKKLMEYDWQYSDFEDNSKRREGDFLHSVERVFEYVAQDQLYYTGVVMPISHAQLLLSVENSLLERYRRRNQKLQLKLKSKTYKIGRIITILPRKAIKFIKNEKK